MRVLGWVEMVVLQEVVEVLSYNAIAAYKDRGRQWRV